MTGHGAAPPSGLQFEITHGRQVAVVTEVGAGLRRYEVAGRPVLASYEVGEVCPAGHGAVLLPWPNRVRDGRYRFAGRELQLELAEPERGNALHGMVRWTRWALVEHAADRVVLALAPPPTLGYPFSLDTRITYTLGPGGLTVDLHATNIGAGDAPYGVGFHPYLHPGPGPLDDAVLSIDADTWVRADERLLPVGTAPIPAGLDFRVARRLGATRLDDAFVDPRRDGAGRSWVRLTGADGATAAVWAGEGLSCWQVYSSDGAPGRHERAALAAEPMSCLADAFRTGERLAVLAPGQTHRARWGLTLTT